MHKNFAPGCILMRNIIVCIFRGYDSKKLSDPEDGRSLTERLRRLAANEGTDLKIREFPKKGLGVVVS